MTRSEPRRGGAEEAPGPRRPDEAVDPTGPRRPDEAVDPTGPRRPDEAADPTRRIVVFLGRVRNALAWPGLYGWTGLVFAAAALWFLPSGLVLRSRAASLVEEGPLARDAAEDARHLGFGEVGPVQTVVKSKTGEDERRWSAPFGFMAPSLRRERARGGSSAVRTTAVPARPGAVGTTAVSARPGAVASGEEKSPVYAVREPLAGRTLALAREGALANARSSIVFGVFCLAAAGFWCGFRMLDPATRRARGTDGDAAEG